MLITTDWKQSILLLYPSHDATCVQCPGGSSSSQHVRSAHYKPAILPTQTEREQRSSTRKRHRLDIELSRSGRLNLYPDALIAQQLDAPSSVGPTIPVTPMDGLPTHYQWMRASRSRWLQQSCGAALPLFGKGIYGILRRRNSICAS
jgi:hypothetical protein